MNLVGHQPIELVFLHRIYSIYDSCKFEWNWGLLKQIQPLGLWSFQ